MWRKVRRDRNETTSTCLPQKDCVLDSLDANNGIGLVTDLFSRRLISSGLCVPGVGIEDATNAPTPHPTPSPTESPTKEPTEAPTKEPTSFPTEAPTKGPTPKKTGRRSTDWENERHKMQRRHGQLLDNTFSCNPTNNILAGQEGAGHPTEAATYVGVVQGYDDERWGGPEEGYSGGMRSLYPQFQGNQITSRNDFYDNAAWQRCKAIVSDYKSDTATGRHCELGSTPTSFHQLNTVLPAASATSKVFDLGVTVVSYMVVDTVQPWLSMAESYPATNKYNLGCEGDNCEDWLVDLPQTETFAKVDDWYSEEKSYTKLEGFEATTCGGQCAPLPESPRVAGNSSSVTAKWHPEAEASVTEKKDFWDGLNWDEYEKKDGVELHGVRMSGRVAHKTTCSFAVVVLDDESPVIEEPSTWNSDRKHVYQTLSNSRYFELSWDHPTASDNVGFRWRKVRRSRNETLYTHDSAIDIGLPLEDSELLQTDGVPGHGDPLHLKCSGVRRYNKDSTCDEEKTGKAYRGCQDKTTTDQYTCLAWNDKKVVDERGEHPKIADEKGVGAHNYCRGGTDPDSTTDGIGCFVEDGNGVVWKPCDPLFTSFLPNTHVPVATSSEDKNNCRYLP
jgi:hypothetical protein